MANIEVEILPEKEKVKKTKRRRKTPPLLFLVIGESGAGKDAIIDIICEKTGRKKVISYTTRSPRFPNEQTHKFVSPEEFLSIQKARRMIAYSKFDEHLYGATLEDVQESDFYIVDPKGLDNFRYDKVGRPVELIYITADEKARRSRMEARGDDPERIDRRIRHDRKRFNPSTYPVIQSSYVFDTSDQSRTIQQYATRLERLINRMQKTRDENDKSSRVEHARDSVRGDGT